MSEKICAVVVTYNRKELLLECLEALLKQTHPLDAIYIIDNNSTDGTQDILKENGYIKESPPEELKEPWEKTFVFQNELINSRDKKITIHYVRMHENTGGAGGFHEGVKRGYEKGYDWLWLMDDDGVASENALHELFACAAKENKSVFNSLVLSNQDYYRLSFGLICQKQRKKETIWCKKELLKYLRDGLFYSANFFNGTFIPLHVIKEIGYPNKDYFIHGDETEYYYRIQSKNIKIFTVYSSEYFHPPKIDNHTLWKSYYRARNEVRNIILYKNIKIPRIIKLFLYFISVNTLKYGLKGGWYIVRGVFDGIFGRMGRVL